MSAVLAENMGKAAETLREARALIRSQGWIKGSLESDAGFCASGAILAAGGTIGDQSFSLLHMVINQEAEDASIPDWNDSCRSRDQVLAAFTAAIKLAKAKATVA